MTNRLATQLTTWKAWYAILALVAFLLAQSVMIVGALIPAENKATREMVNGLLMPVQFIAFAFIALALIALFSRAWPTTEDLGLTARLTRRQILLLIVVFLVSHALFWLSSLTAEPDPGAAARYFTETGLGGPLVTAAAALFAGAVLAPVCEELLYRGAMLRPVHDQLARTGRPLLGAVAGIAVSTILFAMPHLGAGTTFAQTASYLVTGVAMGLVYVITGSMTAAMVAHSLQSMYAWGQIVVLGHGDATVSPLLYVIVFGCPLWTYLVARGLHAVFPRVPAGQPQGQSSSTV